MNYSTEKPTSNMLKQTLIEQTLSDNEDDEHYASVQEHFEYKRRKMGDVHSLNDLLNWYKQDPCGRMSFLFFFIALFIVPPLLFIIYFAISDNTAYILSGLFGLTITVYAFQHFRTVLALRQEITQFAELNGQFKGENIALKDELSRFERAHEALGNVHSLLSDANQKQRECVYQFNLIQTNMKNVNLDTVQGMQILRKHAQKMNNKWEEELKFEQKRFLWNLFERIESKDDTHTGVNKAEFEEFCSLIPNEYSERFERLRTFEKYAKSGVINHEDFGLILDVFAEMFVKDCDMEFVIENVEIHDNDDDDGGNDSKEEIRRFKKQVTVTKTFESGQHVCNVCH